MEAYYSCSFGELYCGDCLEVMSYLAKNGVKVDMVLTDPPYGTTQCKWDSVIPFDKMWGGIASCLSNNGCVVLFGSEPFSSFMRCSNAENFKYDWVWRKSKATGHLNVKKRPLLKHELVSVFYGGKYFPQGLELLDKPILSKGNRGKKGEGSSGECYGLANKDALRKETGYPLSVIDFKVEQKPIHPTQKPVALMEYLIRTYTNFGDTVLDFTIGSGTTAVAAVNTGRHFIGIEREEKYCEIAAKRIEQAIEVIYGA